MVTSMQKMCVELWTQDSQHNFIFILLQNTNTKSNNKWNVAIECSSEHVYYLRSNISPSGPSLLRSLPVGTLGIGQILPISMPLCFYIYSVVFSPHKYGVDWIIPEHMAS